ncbi:MAG: PAS domain S-box protein [Candidatus Thorarchaeota archaeon]
MNSDQYDLKKASDQLKKILDLGPNPVYIWKKEKDDLILIDFNKAGEEFTNNKIKSLFGISASDLYRERQDIIEDLKQCLNEKVRISKEMDYFVQTTGKETVLNVIYDFVPPDLVIVYTEDITEIRNSQKQLLQSEKKYRFFLENFKGIAFQGNIDFTPIFFLGAVEDITGYKENEFIIGSPRWDELILKDDKNNISDSINAIKILPYQAIEREYRIKRKDGKIKWIHENIQNICDKIGKPYLVQGVMYDITERKKAENQLRQSKKRYEDAYDRAEFYKDLFAHDVNNILQGILSSTELIEILTRGDELKPHIKKSLEIIQDQVDRGSRLVYNVRRLSQLEEYNMILEKIEIVSILKKSIDFLKNSFQNKDIEVSLDSFDEVIFIMGNNLIQYVFDNILINSLMHNNSPTIRINIKIAQISSLGNYKYKIEFIDNGYGIEDKRKSLVFNRVNKGAKSVSGMGLGLSLVKKIIDMLKGKIWVEDRIRNDYSKGANFILLLPKVI